jgi:hypothetical protein
MGARARWGGELPAALGFFDAEVSGKFLSAGIPESAEPCGLDRERYEGNVDGPEGTEKGLHSGI